MSDELTIQPQLQPQIQQKKSTAPYVAGGVVGGGVVGALVNNALKKPTSWEAIVNEAKDTTDFSTKAEPASWESVKNDAKTVADLEAKLKNVPEKTLAEDAKEAVDLQKAKDARQAEFDRLFKAEKKTAGKGAGTTIPSWDDVDLPKKKKSEYNAIRDEYRNKLKDMYTDKSGEYHILSKKMEATNANYANKVSHWEADYRRAAGTGTKPAVSLKGYFAMNDATGKKSLIYQDMNNFYQNELKATGKYDITNKKAAKAMRTKAHELTMQQLENMKQYIENTDKLGKIKVDPAQLTAASAHDYKDVIKKTSKQYRRELDIISGDRKVPKKVKADLVSDLTAEYGCTPEKLENVISKRIKIAQKYEPTMDKIAKAKDNSYLSGVYSKQREAYKAGELKSTLAKFKKKFPQLVKTETPVSDSEITAKVNKALEGSTFEKNIASAQAAYDKALEKGGTANTAAKETVEKELAAAREKLQKGATELASKFKKGGTNTWLAAGIGAVIGAAALYGIASSRNKEA